MSSDEGNEEEKGINLLVAMQLQERPEILTKSQIPHIKNKKNEALKHAATEIERKIGKPLTVSQLMKKVNNMKTRLRNKVDKNKTGNKKIVLKQWEKILHELMDGEENPTIGKIQGKILFSLLTD